MALGIAPPMPSPVRKRKPASVSIDCAVAVSSEPTPKISAHPMSTGRRPDRSASGPLTIAPIIIDLERVIDAGDDRVVAMFHQHATGHGSGATVDLHMALLYELENGRVVRMRNFNERHEALEAAGLSE